MADDRRGDELAGPRRRRWRVVVAALAGVVVVLALTVWLGNRFGANDLPGQQVVAGGSGEEIFRNNCMQCHGARGEGGPKVGAPAFTPGGALAGLTLDQRLEKIRRGRPLRGMPRFGGKLSPEDIRKVAEYTMTLSEGDR